MKKNEIILIVLTLLVPEIIFRLPIPYVVGTYLVDSVYFAFYLSRIIFTLVAIFFVYSFLKKKKE